MILPNGRIASVGQFLHLGGDKLSTEKRLSRGDCMLIAMGLLLIAAIIYIALTAGGSAKATNEATEKIWAYIDENYPDITVENYGEAPKHIGAGSYSLLVSDADCCDVSFYVSYTNGNITDDYYHRVSEMTNTLLRLESSMGEYFGALMKALDTDIVRTEAAFPPRVRNDIPDSIYLGVSFDPAHPIYRGSTLTIVCKASKDMKIAAELIRKARAIAEENGILFSCYEVYGIESSGAYSLEITGIDADTADDENLSDILSSVLTGNITVSESDIEGISVRVH